MQTHQSHKGKQNQNDKIHQQAFDNVNTTIARDVTLAYPDYTQGFEIYTDRFKLQLGAVISTSSWQTLHPLQKA